MMAGILGDQHQASHIRVLPLVGRDGIQVYGRLWPNCQNRAALDSFKGLQWLRLR